MTVALDPGLVRRAASHLTAEERAEVDRLLEARIIPTFRDWLPTVSPEWTWDWPHLRKIQAALEAIGRREIDQLILIAPVRHGKSEQVTVRYPVYELLRQPQTRIVLGCYGQGLADKFSRKARRLARAAGVQLSAERTAASDWETEAGGGVRAVGVGGGITGQGGDLLLVDDPVKSRREAESPVYRQLVWDWWVNDLYTRAEPGAAKVITMARWHDDDLVGRILNSPDASSWTVLHMPALADAADDPLGRAVGEALCPARYTAEKLQRIRRAIGDYAFNALFQGRPQPRTGTMFPRGMVGSILPVAPAGTRWCRGWDNAGSKDRGKYTAGVKIGITPAGRVVVGHVARGQWEADQRYRTQRTTAEVDGREVLVAIEQEPGSSGKDVKSATIKLLQGFRVVIRPATGDKVLRAEPFAAQWQAGNVDLVLGDWNEAYLEEMAAAPTGNFLDQMDGSSIAYNRLVGAGVVYDADAYTPIQR